MGTLGAKQSPWTGLCRVTAAGARFGRGESGLPFAHVTPGQSRARIRRWFLSKFDNYINKLSIHVNLRPLSTSPPWFGLVWFFLFLFLSCCISPGKRVTTNVDSLLGFGIGLDKAFRSLPFGKFRSSSNLFSSSTLTLYYIIYYL